MEISTRKSAGHIKINGLTEEKSITLIACIYLHYEHYSKHCMRFMFYFLQLPYKAVTIILILQLRKLKPERLGVLIC